MEPSNQMKYEGLTRLEHLLHLLQDRVDHSVFDQETHEYLNECHEFIDTVREIWY